MGVRRSVSVTISLGALFVRTKVKPWTNRAQGTSPQNPSRLPWSWMQQGIFSAAQPLVLTTGRKVTRAVGDVVSRVRLGRVARVYECGELTVSKVSANSAAKAPSPTYGKRKVAGVSRNGARMIRRSVVARANAGHSQFVLLTLTSDRIRSDQDMKHHLDKFLKWGRKHLGEYFDWYIWVAELQQRGVLHFHVLLCRRIPRGLFLRLRYMWAEFYGMGAGSFDAKSMRSAKGTAKYLAKYVVKRPAEGERRVSRHNGKEYVRDFFQGNAYGLSGAARWGTTPAVQVVADWGAFPGLDGWHGVMEFYDTRQEAEQRLAEVLALDDLSAGFSA